MYLIIGIANDEFKILKDTFTGEQSVLFQIPYWHNSLDKSLCEASLSYSFFFFSFHDIYLFHYQGEFYLFISFKEIVGSEKAMYAEPRLGGALGGALSVFFSQANRQKITRQQVVPFRFLSRHPRLHPFVRSLFPSFISSVAFPSVCS